MISICEGNLDCPIPIETEQGYVYKTPKEMITPLSWEYIKAFGFYEKSILPNGNGWINESGRFIEAMMLIESGLSRIRIHKQKESNNGK